MSRCAVTQSEYCVTTVLTLSSRGLAALQLAQQIGIQALDAVDEQPRRDAFFVAEMVVQAADAAA